MPFKRADFRLGPDIARTLRPLTTGPMLCDRAPRVAGAIIGGDSRVQMIQGCRPKKIRGLGSRCTARGGSDEP